MRKRVYLFLLSLLAVFYFYSASGQSEVQAFKSAQFSSAHVSEAFRKYNDTLRESFMRKNVAYPPKNILLRAFKSQNELELWAQYNDEGAYKLIKTYRICSVSGALGPKRGEGDHQVPEGFYFIDEFNTQSDYYLALLLDYPNYSDKQLSPRPKLGGDIYIHGGCVTIGCLPMTDDGIKEIYTVCLNARLNGQENIPVHIYPTRLNKNGMSYLSRSFPNDQVKQQFWQDMRTEYEYFEKYHKLLPVMYAPGGRYIN